MTDADQPKHTSLPFPKWWPFLAGALTGIALRLAFAGGPGDPFGAMMGSFIFLVPVAVSVVTVYVAERQAPRSYGYHAVAGMLANVIFVIGTLLILVEGLICAIVILPLFMAIGALSGAIMAAICRLTRWPKQVASCIAVLPLIIGGIEPPQGQPVRERTIERSLVIEAPRELVWAQLANIRGIESAEVADTLAFRIGVPAPVSATTRESEGKRVRRISMGKHVYFDQEEVERREFERIRWVQRFYADSFPAGSFDQHVVMGGEYFDIQDVSYSLSPAGTTTRLTIAMRYRVSTRFNWYADGVARIVLGNLEETLLRLYATRAVSAAQVSLGGSDGLEQRI